MFYIIEPTQDAVKVMYRARPHKDDNINQPSTIPMTIWCWGLSAGEEIEIQFPKVLRPDAAVDADWTDSVDEKLTVADWYESLYAPGYLRFVKPTTTNAVGVMGDK